MSMRRLRIALVALAIGSGAMHQACAAEVAIPESKQKAIIELLEAMQYSTTIAKIVPSMVEAIGAQMPASSDVNKAKIARILKEELGSAMQKREGDFTGLQVNSLNRNFSEAEIVALTEFYRTPLGAKMIGYMQGAMGADALEGAKIGQEAATEAMPRILERMRAEGLLNPQGL